MNNHLGIMDTKLDPPETPTTYPILTPFEMLDQDEVPELTVSNICMEMSQASGSYIQMNQVPPPVLVP